MTDRLTDEDREALRARSDEIAEDARLGFGADEELLEAVVERILSRHLASLESECARTWKALQIANGAIGELRERAEQAEAALAAAEARAGEAGAVALEEAAASVRDMWSRRGPERGYYIAHWLRDCAESLRGDR